MPDNIPIVLFAYARPDHLRRTLDCLRENQVPLIYAFSDGARTPDKAPAVEAVRQMLREINWCEVTLTERESNLGLGRSILSGVTEVFQKHDAMIVFEDDLICVPGTYPYLCAALEHYRDEPRVMSVTGYNHPRICPDDVGDQPYFDGRFQSWSWGAWARSWKGMDKTAYELMQACKAKGIDPAYYGADLPYTARREQRMNVWAIRFVYLHILNQGLVLHPPHSMVENIGSGASATNTPDLDAWSNLPLQSCPPIPEHWPEPIENPKAARLYQEQYKHVKPLPRYLSKMRRGLRRVMRWLQ